MAMAAVTPSAMTNGPPLAGTRTTAAHAGRDLGQQDERPEARPAQSRDHGEPHQGVDVAQRDLMRDRRNRTARSVNGPAMNTIAPVTR